MAKTVPSALPMNLSSTYLQALRTTYPFDADGQFVFSTLPAQDIKQNIR